MFLLMYFILSVKSQFILLSISPSQLINFLKENISNFLTIRSFGRISTPASLDQLLNFWELSVRDLRPLSAVDDVDVISVDRVVLERYLFLPELVERHSYTVNVRRQSIRRICFRHGLWRRVPPGGERLLNLPILLLIDIPRKTEISKFAHDRRVHVGIEKVNVCRPHVSEDDARAVEEPDGLGDVVPYAHLHLWADGEAVCDVLEVPVRHPLVN